MSLKKVSKKSKDILLAIDFCLLLVAILLGCFCGFRFTQIASVENDALMQSISDLETQISDIDRQLSLREQERDTLIAQSEETLKVAQIQRDQVQQELYDVIALRDEAKGKVTDVQSRIDEMNSMEQTIADLRTEYGQTVRKLEDMIMAGESDYKIVYLTFDDGPSYITMDFLDELERLDVYATFFTIGCSVDKSASAYRDECLRREAMDGHTIANHTYTHAFGSGLYDSVDSFMSAVQKQDDLVYEVTGMHTDIVRFPAGSYYCRHRTKSIEALEEAGYGWIDWLGNAYDSGGNGYSAAYTASIVINQARTQKIYVVLMHDWVLNTKLSLEKIVTTLQKEGYVFLPLFKESSQIGNVYPKWDN